MTSHLLEYHWINRHATGYILASIITLCIKWNSDFHLYYSSSVSYNS